jgi:hypothetical protein
LHFSKILFRRLGNLKSSTAAGMEGGGCPVRSPLNQFTLTDEPDK